MTYPPYEPYPVSASPNYPPPPDRQLPPPSRTQAGWALGLAIIPSLITWIVAVVLACSVISRSNDGRDHGRRMAVAALVIMGLWVALAITVVAILAVTAADRDEGGRVTDGGRSTILGLRMGDCMPAPEASDAGQLTVAVVPCGESHDAEVFATFDLDGEWTNLDDVTEISSAGCLERFSDYIGASPSGSSLDVLYYFPDTETSFDKNSRVVCILRSPQPVRASLKGSGGVPGTSADSA